MSLESNVRYNPLNNNLDPYAQAFNIASIITSGRGKELSGSSPIRTRELRYRAAQGEIVYVHAGKRLSYRDLFWMVGGSVV